MRLSNWGSKVLDEVNGYLNQKRLFITGIPAAGKSYLANKLAVAIGGIHVPLDDIREVAARDPQYQKWVNFYLDQDEKNYFATTSPAEQWTNLVRQSEGLWPLILAKVESFKNETQPVIFEGVNILPHLAHRDLKFPGLVLIGQTLDEILERNKRDPRWGATEELQKIEAESFFNIERPNYKSEGEKYGYPIFETAAEAELYALSVLQ